MQLSSLLTILLNSLHAVTARQAINMRGQMGAHW